MSYLLLVRVYYIFPVDIEPLSLQELCRTTVRNLLRRNIELEHPRLKASRSAEGL
jgi:hypothetical protein